jgi:hypothetical protein
MLTGVIGQTQTGTGFTNPRCNPTLCDLYNLTVNVQPSFYAANPNFAIHVSASWSSNLNEYDLYIYDSNNNLVGMATQSNTTSNDADLGQLPSGTYQVQVVRVAQLGTWSDTDVYEAHVRGFPRLPTLGVRHPGLWRDSSRRFRRRFFNHCESLIAGIEAMKHPCLLRCRKLKRADRAALGTYVSLVAIIIVGRLPRGRIQEEPIVASMLEVEHV